MNNGPPVHSLHYLYVQLFIMHSPRRTERMPSREPSEYQGAYSTCMLITVLLRVEYSPGGRENPSS